MTERMIEAVIQHGWLAIAIGVFYWFATPHLVKKTLTNGGGEIVRNIIRAENATQSEGIGEKFTHVRERLAVLETRISDHISKVA